MNRGFVFCPPSVVVILVLSVAVHHACGECWDTGCQSESWLVKGCEEYGMKEIKRKPCSGGHVYSCCHRHNSSSEKLSKIGDLTYYNLGLTACGQVYTNDDMVAAIAFGHFKTPNPNFDPMCGRRVKIVDPVSAKSIIVTVRDKCEGCKTNDIDVSPSAFEKLKPKIVGRFKVSWDFI
ncbi:uncharacterized protein LOC111029775 [Myzus persicae]|uniref:uncharacterized protein LOC111029775 n=1 Tax=Myzus persicae TaxID=13164 RepID=UPI000B9386FC|nr:uncharacterized protein LOC111029775 [Myzus persicae]